MSNSGKIASAFSVNELSMNNAANPYQPNAQLHLRYFDTFLHGNENLLDSRLIMV